MNTGMLAWMYVCTHQVSNTTIRTYSKGISNYDTTFNQFHVYNGELGFIQCLMLINQLTI